MTIGTITLPQNQRFFNGIGAVAPYGDFFHKSWNGQDDPVRHSKFNSYTMTLREGFDPICNRNDPPSEFPAWSSIGSPPTIDSLNPIWGSNDESDFITTFARKVKGHSFNAGTTLGEAHQSVKMITNAATSIASAIRSVRRGDLRAAAADLGVTYSPSRTFYSNGRIVHLSQTNRSLDRLSKNWLSMQYGWLPIILDAKNAAEAVASRISQRELKIPIKYSKVVSESTSQISNTAATYSVKHKVVRSAQVLYKDTSFTHHLGLDDPLVVAWELVPYSFVVDWFLPIGTYLEAYNAIPFLNSYEGYTSTYTSVESTLVDPGPNFPNLTVMGTSSLKDVRYTRTDGVSFDRSDIKPKFVPITESFSVKRLLSAISLLTQSVLH